MVVGRGWLLSLLVGVFCWLPTGVVVVVVLFFTGGGGCGGDLPRGGDRGGVVVLITTVFSSSPSPQERIFPLNSDLLPTITGGVVLILSSSLVTW